LEEKVTMYDSHIHSKFSADSIMDATEACQKAVDIGLDGIVFTDHIDIDYPDFDESFNIDLDKHAEFFEKLTADWEGRLKVLKGIEIGYQPHVVKEMNDIFNKYSFDFVIGSVHIIEKTDPYTGKFYIGKSQRQAYTIYLEEILRSINDFDNFDVVGHIGYAARYGNYENKKMLYADYCDVMDKILKDTIHKGKGIEINTSGLRTDLESTIPGYDVFERYFELGGEIITIGSDSHEVQYLGYKFDAVIEQLKKIGFKYITHFEKRKPVFEKI
jgi:histidinol-phosphatase (PHP family)